MKKTLLTLLLSIPLFGLSQTYAINTTNSYVEFYFVSKDVHGTMTGVNASIVMDFENLSSSKVIGSVLVSSLSTKNEGRDHHLMADDMFDAEKYPEMKFESSEISSGKGGKIAEGKLTIRDVTKNVTFNVINENEHLVFSTEINSVDFGVEIKSNYEDNAVQVKVFIPMK